MTYYTAQKCFEENLRLIGEPMSNPLMYNLSTGLLNLTRQLQTDISQLQTDVHEVKRRLDELRRNVS